MKIAILGYGKEGKSAESYFQNQHHDIKIFDQFTSESLAQEDLSGFDLVFRSPSVAPQPGWTSITKYFFDHCSCPIIGVTGTKGKGTTCSIITAILQALSHKVWLVGNIGTPALDVLDQIQPSDIVVYEMSSFQLWDLEKSPHVAVVLRIEPDHLNVHKDFADYISAKSNIVRHQTLTDYCIYYSPNADSTKVAQLSPGIKIAYPQNKARLALDALLDHLAAPGQHNRENAEAALLAVAASQGLTLDELLSKHQPELVATLANFQGLPHRLQFLRTNNNVSYYDDNFSSSFPALDVALAAFPTQTVVLIAGGKDRGIDPTPAQKRIFQTANLAKVFLIGETKGLLASGQDPNHYQLCDSLTEAFQAANHYAQTLATQHPEAPVILLMSPGAPSFDMFTNFADRGEQFQKLVQGV